MLSRLTTSSSLRRFSSTAKGPGPGAERFVTFNHRRFSARTVAFPQKHWKISSTTTSNSDLTCFYLFSEFAQPTYVFFFFSEQFSPSFFFATSDASRKLWLHHHWCGLGRCYHRPPIGKGCGGQCGLVTEWRKPFWSYEVRVGVQDLIDLPSGND